MVAAAAAGLAAALAAAVCASAAGGCRSGHERDECDERDRDQGLLIGPHPPLPAPGDRPPPRSALTLFRVSAWGQPNLSKGSRHSGRPYPGTVEPKREGRSERAAAGGEAALRASVPVPASRLFEVDTLHVRERGELAQGHRRILGVVASVARTIALASSPTSSANHRKVASILVLRPAGCTDGASALATLAVPWRRPYCAEVGCADGRGRKASASTHPACSGFAHTDQIG